MNDLMRDKLCNNDGSISLLAEMAAGGIVSTCCLYYCKSSYIRYVVVVTIFWKLIALRIYKSAKFHVKHTDIYENCLSLIHKIMKHYE